MKTSDGGDVVFGAHCHAPDPAREEIAIARDKITRRAATTQESSHLIVTNETNRLSASAAASLPSREALKRAVQRERVRSKNAPPNPASFQDLQIPEEYQQTIAGAGFLLYDNGPGAGNLRFLVFGTAANVTRQMSGTPMGPLRLFLICSASSIRYTPGCKVKFHPLFILCCQTRLKRSMSGYSMFCWSNVPISIRGQLCWILSKAR